MFGWLKRWFTPKAADAIVVLLPRSLTDLRGSFVNALIAHLLDLAEKGDLFSVVVYGQEATARYLWQTAAALKERPLGYGPPSGSTMVYRGMERAEWCFKRLPKDRPYRRRILLLTAASRGCPMGIPALPHTRLDVVCLTEPGYRGHYLSLPEETARIEESGGEMIYMSAPTPDALRHFDRLFIRED